MQQWRRAFVPSLGSFGLLGSLAWGCAHTHQSNGEAGQSWYLGASYGNALLLQIQGLEQLLDSLQGWSTSWDCSGNTHTLLGAAEMGCRHPQSSWAHSKCSSHSALLSSFPCQSPSAQSQVPVQGFSSPKAFSRMGSRDLQLQARFSSFCCHPRSGRALVHRQEVTQGTVPVPSSSCTQCSPPAHLIHRSSHRAKIRKNSWKIHRGLSQGEA